MALDAYRPRRKTREEEDDDFEHNERRKKARHFSKRRDDQQGYTTTATLQISSSGIGYRDYVHVSSRAGQSRWRVDEQAYLQRTPTPRLAFRPLPSLSAICIRAVAASYGDPGVLDSLSAQHGGVASELVREIARAAPNGVLPFNVWVAFAEAVGLPRSRRTYRGLCLEDVEELDDLNECNKYASAEALRIPRPPTTPTFFLAIVDLSHDTTFRDGDVSKLYPAAPFLAVLRLDYTHVSDNGLASLVRNVDVVDGFQRLEVLCLKGLKKVTDHAARKISKLPGLRMLDIRETSCTAAFAQIVYGNSRNPERWRSAAHRADLSDLINRELEVFGTSLSLSNVLTSLRVIASRYRHVSDELLDKPTSVHIDSVARYSPNPQTEEDLYNSILATKKPPSTHATYNRTYGNITSTASLNSDVLRDDAYADAEKGAAFRMRDDGISAGATVGPRRVGAYTTLFERGTRKASPTRGRVEAPPLSDGSDDEDDVEGKPSPPLPADDPAREFYHPIADRHPEPKLPPFPAKSPLMLLRHLPVSYPFEAPRDPPPEEDVKRKPEPVRVDEGASLLRKKQRGEEATPVGLVSEVRGEASSSPSNARAFAGPRSSLPSVSAPTSGRLGTPQAQRHRIPGRHLPVLPGKAGPVAPHRPAFLGSVPRSSSAGLVGVKAPGAPLARRRDLAVFRR